MALRQGSGIPVRYVTKTWSVVLLNKKVHILLSQVFCVWQVVKTPTIILNNPVFIELLSFCCAGLGINTVKCGSVSDTCKGANCVAVRNVFITGSLNNKAVIHNSSKIPHINWGLKRSIGSTFFFQDIFDLIEEHLRKLTVVNWVVVIKHFCWLSFR